MTSFEIRQMIEGFVREEIVPLEASFEVGGSLESQGIESLDLLEIVFFIERTFHCKLPQEVLKGENSVSLDSLANFTSNFLKKSAVS